MLGELAKGMLFVGGGPGGYENFHWIKSRLRKMMCFQQSEAFLNVYQRGQDLDLPSSLFSLHPLGWKSKVEGLSQVQIVRR